MEANLYQSQRQQVALLAATVFGSIVAAVIASTLIIMQLVHGQIASALTSTVQPTTQTANVTGTCVAPADTDDEASAAQATAAGTSKLAPMFGYRDISGSFNSSSVVNNTNTTNTTNTENHTKTIIKDSYNVGSYNDDHTKNIDKSDNSVVIKNNGNSVTDDHSLTIGDVKLNLNSNNTTSIDNSVTTVIDASVETHILSDNYVDVL